MDTSDGLIATLDQLMRLNDVGFELIKKILEKIIDENALNYFKELNIPPWLLLAGQHGEFELVFTIPITSQKSFLEEIAKNGFEPVELGKVNQEKEIRMKLHDKIVSINSVFIRNLPLETKGDINHYLKLLLEYDSQLKNAPSLNFTTI